MRSILAAVLLAALSLASAQILDAPVYYLTTAPELEVGGSLSGELTAASGQNFKDGSRVAVVVLRAEPGAPLVIDVSSDAFDAFLTVFGPDGALIDAVDDGPAGLDPQLVVTPERAGAHLLVISGFGPYDVGPFTVSASPVELAEAQPLPATGRVEATLSGAEPTDPEVGYGPTRSFTLELDEPALVRIQAASSEFDTVLAVFDAYGWLDQNDDSGDTTDSQLLLDLAPGRYRVAVAAWGSGAGAFTVTTQRYVAVD